MLTFIGSMFLGWGLGTNDAANVFGTAVSSRMVKWRTAALLAALFVVLGAVVQGGTAVETLTNLTPQTRLTATITVFAAAFTVMFMTLLKLPISASQAVVGSIFGIGLMQGNLNPAGTTKILLCWLGTPVGGAVFYIFFHLCLSSLVKAFKPSMLVLDPLIRGGLIIFGCYGAYALGANNVANVSAVLVGSGLLERQLAVLVGGVSIAVGILTLSKPVMLTVGRQIVEVNTFSALNVILAEAATVHLYAFVGVPVSTSQAVVGGLLGIGLLKGLQLIRWRTLTRVSLAWAATPFIGAALAMLFYIIAHLEYRP
ncbi:MAG: anion permease [Lentisphaeria bacterium]